MHCANGGVLHEHSKHGSPVSITSPIFNVKLPYRQVCSDSVAFFVAAAILSVAVAVENQN